MKILLDENIDVDFRKDFPSGHEVYTVRYMQWTGVKNGAMLRLLKEHGFDCWVVVDKSIPYQQNIAALPCLVAVMDVKKNNRSSLQAMLPQLLRALANLPGERVMIIGGD